ncbi:siphovirus ReqiPepy6 Gp37-like family protein [Streptomyces hesseae]|uniref:Siphovirus ReqiPepy6 Gp37-like family protein n=1 Tax=Streptomyces hesseae TaxID=3075519 RepID=A0ABU2SVE0_9ACTN|nr:siphovirus ReqiPepy6 Gp37-like family protein [Streptomyces sp. DSM 40473]MDT0451874.1 siphovirus ReqiPepy6 Gp37-like family protein [Streptomyces sp. DSM 40473]
MAARPRGERHLPHRHRRVGRVRGHPDLSATTPRSLTLRRYRVDVRDAALRRVGQIDSYTSLDVIVRHLDVGAWTLVLPADHPHAHLFATGGHGVMIWSDDATEPLLTGPLTSIRDNWSATGGTLTFSGVCDNAALATRLAFPDPTRAPDTGNGRYAVDYWSSAGPAGDIITRLVAANAGPTALPGRRVPGLDPGPTTGLGAPTKISLRFDTLLSAIQTLASTAGLTVRVTQPDPTTPRLALQIGTTRDLRGMIRFSPGLGNLSSYSYQLTAPRTTRAIIAAQGQGKDRFFWQWDTPDAEAEWARVGETFVDQRDTAIPARLDASDDQFRSLRTSAANALQQGGAQADLSLAPIDTEQCQYGRDYRTGDTVTVTTTAGTDLVYPVREVHLTDAADASSVQATVGTEAATQTPALYAQVRRLWQAVHQLNTRY